MQYKKPLLLVLTILSLGSCKKFETVKVREHGINDLVVPIGFTWENSRNIKISVENNDTRFGNVIHQISLYDGDPASSGKLLSAGSASNSSPFISKIYLPYLISAIYIVKTAPDNSTKTIKLSAGNTDLATSIGR